MGRRQERSEGRGLGRSAAKERFWRERVAAWRASGLAVRAYCVRQRLAEPSFYAWRRELARREQGESRRRAGTDPSLRPG